MDCVVPGSELAALLERYDAIGGVLDYIFIEVPTTGSPYDLHRAAALKALAVIDSPLEQIALTDTSEDFPPNFRLRWDANKMSGKQVDFATFWGTDDIEPECFGKNAWSPPNIDGYKTAFFHPPYGLGGTASQRAEVFEGINRHLLGEKPEQAEIFSWSTDWSNYFDAGHEWWGAFFWTIRQPGLQRFGVVGASSSD